MNDPPRDDDELTMEELANPATRMRIEAMKILVTAILEETGSITYAELKRRLGISEEPRP